MPGQLICVAAKRAGKIARIVSEPFFDGVDPIRVFCYWYRKSTEVRFCENFYFVVLLVMPERRKRHPMCGNVAQSRYG